MRGHPHSRPVGVSPTAAIAVAALLAGALAACESGQITEPVADVAQAATAAPEGVRIVSPPDGFIAAGRGATAICWMAVRGPDGGYLKREVTVTLTPEMMETRDRRTVLAARGWRAGDGDPTRLIACDVPDTPEARAWFEEAVAGGQARPVPQAVAAELGGRSLSVYDVAALIEPCEQPYAIEPDEPADPCEPADEWEGPPPEEPEPTYGSLTPETTDSGVYYSMAPYYQPTSCWGQTDMPHRSYHVPGTVNVVARTWCTFPTTVYVSTQLARQRCFLIFCWWSTQASNAATGVTRVQTNAAGFCQRGWWRGGSFHTALIGGRTAYGWTANYNRIDWC